MAASSRILCLNLGMQTISLGDFRKNPNGGLTMQAFHSTQLIADPGADVTRNDQIKMVLSELREKIKAKRSEKINYSLPSQAVFTRFVKLPETSSEQIDQIIGFEAQQNVPFPIDEVVWDYQVLGKASEAKMDVVLVAIKADQLNEINNSVEEPGFAAGVIDAAPMALYNAFRYNYSELTGCSLIIDIGARTTNLIFIENERVFSRSIPIGGNTISAAIAKEFNLDLATAEELKKAKGFVGLGGAYAEPDDQTVAKISKLIRNTLTRLHAEIARSISFYRSNHAGSQPVRTYLAGGTVSFAYMREFFNEKLQMPIEFFNPLRNIVVSPTSDVENIAKSAHIIGELVGLATRDLGNCPITLNLQPPRVIQAQQLAKQKPYLIAAAACLFCILGAWGYYYYQTAEITRQALNTVNTDISGLDRYAKQFDALNLEQKKLQEVAAPLLLAITERTAWAAILDDLAAKLPPRFIWVTRLTPLSKGTPVDLLPSGIATGNSSRQQGTSTFTPPPPQPQPPDPQPSQGGPEQVQKHQIDSIEIQGLYLDNQPKQAEVIDDFYSNLTKSEQFSVDEKSKDKLISRRSTPDNLTWAYGYTITLPLKHPIDLP